VHSLHKAGKAGISKTKVRAIETLLKLKGLTVKEARKVLRFAKGTGPVQETVQFLNKLDPRTVRAIADGSGNIDEAYREVILRQYNTDAIDDDQIDTVVQLVENDLTGDKKHRAKQLIIDTEADGAGIRLIDELEPADRDTMLTLDDSAVFSDFSGWNSWRTDLAKAVKMSWDNPANTEQAINKYLKDLRTIDNAETEIEIAGKSQSLVNEIEDNPGGFPGTANEVRRVVDYIETEGVNKITVEPAPEGSGFEGIDLRISTSGDTGDTYIELKRINSKKRNAIDVADKFVRAHDGFTESAAEKMIDPKIDTTKVEIDAKSGFKEDITINSLKNEMERRLNSIDDVKVGEVVIELPNSMGKKRLTGTIKNGNFQWDT